jgi:hypothetical protein
MTGFIDSLFWLVTGKDWEQSKENLKCNLAICDHDHVTRDKPEEKKKDEEKK